MSISTIQKMNPKMLVSDIANFLDCSVPNIYNKLKSIEKEHIIEKRKSYITHDIARELFKFKDVPKKVISVQTPKGGVGKTTITREVAVRSSLYGKKVLIIDIDHQGNLTNSFGIQGEKHSSFYQVLKGDINIKESIINVLPGIDIIASNLKNSYIDDFMLQNTVNINKVFRKHINKILDCYDIIIFDCPPSNSRCVSSANVCADLIAIPIIPDDFSIDGLKMIINRIQMLNEEFDSTTDYKIIINRFDARTKASLRITSSLINDPILGEKCFENYIGINQDFTNYRMDGLSIFDAVRQSKCCEDIDKLTQEILGISNG
tara:strand:- start:243 stop:1199 length:957 start_codon:yes stop_codon:yes gene_type:complete